MIINISSQSLIFKLIEVNLLHLLLNGIFGVPLSKMRSRLVLFINLIVFYDLARVITALVNHSKSLLELWEDVFKLRQSDLLLFFYLIFVNVGFPDSEHVFPVYLYFLVLILANVFIRVQFDHVLRIKFVEIDSRVLLACVINIDLKSLFVEMACFKQN